MMTRRALGCLILVAVASTSAQAQTFNKRKMEGLVQQILEQRAGVRDATVDCPLDTPIGVGERAVCSAVSRDGSTFSVDLIQTDETGGINFIVTDDAALEALQPAALDFIERWKSDDIEGIMDSGHVSLRQSTRGQDFGQLLQCTAADFGGLDALGETVGAAIHRGDGSGQLITGVRFEAGVGRITLDYMLADGQWELSGVSMPVLELDHSSISSDALVRHAARLFERIDAGDWTEVSDMLSYELRREATEQAIRAALDDPWKLGPVRRVEMTSYGRNAGNLPIIFAKLVRERGEQRAWFVLRSCGDEWKVRSMQMLDPATELPLAPISEVQLDIVHSLAEKGVEVSLKCPGSEIAIMPSVVFTCQAAHDSGITAPLEIAIGEEGDVSWELLGGAEWDPLFQ